MLPGNTAGDSKENALNHSESECKLGQEELERFARDFDHHSGIYRDHAVEVLSHMQAKCPFAHSSHYGGFWVATKPDTILEIAKNADALSSFPAQVIPALEPTLMIPLNSDPPELYDYRAILNPLFSPKKVVAMAAEIRATAHRLMDAIVERGSGDLVNDFALPLTGITTLRLLGIDWNDWPHYAQPMHELVYSGRPMEERIALTTVMVERMRGEIRKQKTNPTPGSVIEYLHNVDMAGRKLRLDEIDSIVLIVIGGGFDTTQALIGMASVYLGRNPDRRQELIDDLGLLDGAIEEFLRVFPPTQGSSRRATKEVTVSGQLLKPGEQVFMSWAAANRDPDEFPNPNQIDFRRENNKNYSFGLGPHRCLGSHLARLEAKACLEALLQKAPHYRLNESGVELATDIGTVAGYNTIPIIV
jgi:cytochrome P450